MFRAIIFAFLILLVAAVGAVRWPMAAALFAVATVGAVLGIRYFLNVFIVFDQALNAIFGPIFNVIFKNPLYKFGYPDETISSVLGKNILLYPNGTDKSIFIVNGWLSKLDPNSKNHSVDSIEFDEGKQNDEN